MAKKTALQKFGERIRSLRKEKGFSQEELGFQAKLDRTYIGGIERGERNPSLVNIAKIAKAFDMKLKDLFDL